MIFGETTPVKSDRKCKFHRFCPARSDCDNVDHEILLLQVIKCIQLAHRQNLKTSAEIFFIPARSEETFLFYLNLHIKSSVPNLYERILRMLALIGLKKHISAYFIHQ